MRIRVRAILCATAMMLSPVAVSGKVRDAKPGANLPASVVDAKAARTSDIDIGRIGTGQTREDVARATRIVPTARANNSIANRVQSRLRNCNYDPVTNASAPFAAA